jgi:hypothetical protein
LTKKEEKVTVQGKDYFWCTGDHWSGGVKHNGMYTDHKNCDHGAWRSRMDERQKRYNGEPKETKETSSKPAEAPSQKLALNDKLRNAFCTQAGLSAEVIDRI